MALKAAILTITTTPTELNAAETDSVSGQSVTITNAGSAPIYLGGPDVTPTAGFPVPAGGSISLELDATEKAYAVATTGTPVNCLWRGL